MVWTCWGKCHPEIVSTSAAACLSFREVGGVDVNVEDHVTGGITDCGVGVCGGVINQPQGFGVGLFCAFCLLCRNGSGGGEHGGVDRNLILQESYENLLY